MKTQHRVMMWSGPRNISTAMMYSFAQRNDTKVIDEPLYGAYLARSNSNHPIKEQVVSTLENNSIKIFYKLSMHDFGRRVLFIKNMAHHMMGEDLNMINDFSNFFLVRKPREVVSSLSKTISKPTLADTGFDMQKKLVTHLKNLGHVPVVIQTSSILKNPRKFLSKICELIGIEFQESMLSWEKGGIPEDGIWAKYWYKNVHNSTQFGAYNEKPIQLSDPLEKLADECRDYYNFLMKNAL